MGTEPWLPGVPFASPSRCLCRTPPTRGQWRPARRAGPGPRSGSSTGTWASARGASSRRRPAVGLGAQGAAPGRATPATRSRAELQHVAHHRRGGGPPAGPLAVQQHLAHPVAVYVQGVEGAIHRGQQMVVGNQAGCTLASTLPPWLLSTASSLILKPNSPANWMSKGVILVMPSVGMSSRRGWAPVTRLATMASLWAVSVP